MMEDEVSRIDELISRFQNSDGAKLFRRLRVLEQGTKTLKTNHNRLQEAITDARSATVESVRRDTDTLNDSMTLRIATEFHNFLWATKAAYESGETIRTEYFTDDMSRTYRGRMSLQKGRGELMKQLRNHTQHTFPLPVKVSSRPSLLESYRESTDAEVYLRRSDIEEHVDLNRAASEYLESLDGPFELDNEARRYYQEAAKANTILVNLYVEEYWEELMERDRIARELKQLAAEHSSAPQHSNKNGA
jgi:signal transduction histidine kinase